MTRSRDLADSADKDITGTLTVDALTSSGAITGNLTGDVTGNLTPDVGLGTSSPAGYGATLNVRGNQSTGENRNASVIAESNDAATFITMYSGVGGSDLPSIVYPSAGLRFGAGAKDTSTYAEKIRISSDGNLGIQSQSPAASLHVTEASSGLTARFSNDTNQTLDIGTVSGVGSGGGVYLNNPNSGNIDIQVNGSSRLYITPSKFGFGDTSIPSSVASFKGGGTNQVNVSHSSNSSWGLLLGQSDSSNNADYHQSTSGQNMSCAVVNVNDDALHFGTNNDRRMTIHHSGNVGIGTAVPSRLQYGSTDPKLHVKGAGTSGYTLAARFENGDDGGNDRGSAILVNHSNDRGMLIEGGRGTGDQGVGMLSILNSGATRTECIRLKQITTSHASVTMPSQPHFIAYTSGSFSYTGNSGAITINNFATLINQGSHFNTSNGRFTAPVTGTYFFGFQLLLQNVAAGDDSIHISFYKNGSQDVYANLRAPGSSAVNVVGYGNYLPVIGHNVARLSANDTYDIRLSSSGNMNVYSSQGWSRYWGYLLG